MTDKTLTDRILELPAPDEDDLGSYPIMRPDFIRSIKTLARSHRELLEAAKALLNGKVDTLFENAVRLRSAVEEAQYTDK